MAALDFPAAPTVGQQYAAPNGVTYQWDGAAWVITGGPPGQLWTGAGATLTPTDPTKTVSVPGGAAGAGVSTIVLGSNTGKVRIQASNLIPAPSLALATNRDAITGVQDDNTKPSWELDLSTNGDLCQVTRQVPAGGLSTLLKLDNAGNLTIPGTLSKAQYGAMAIRTTALSIANSAVTTIAMDSAPVLRGNVWTAGNASYIATPVVGVYLCLGQITWATHSAGITIVYLTNKAGTNISLGYFGATTGANQTHNTVGLYTVTDPTDYMQLQCFQNSGAAVSLAGTPLALLAVWRLGN
jgi:hypothetical protein